MAAGEPPPPFATVWVCPPVHVQLEAATGLVEKVGHALQASAPESEKVLAEQADGTVVPERQAEPAGHFRQLALLIPPTDGL